MPGSRKKYSYLLAAAAIPAAVCGGFWLASMPDPASPDIGASASDGMTIGAQAMPDASPADSIQPAPASSGAVGARPVNPMLQALHETRSGRAFVQYALQHPEWGGVFYSRALLRSCWLVRAGDDRLQDLQAVTDQEHDGHAHRRRAEALQQLMQKCSDFTADELSGADLSSAPVGRDKLDAASASLLEATRNKRIDGVRLAMKSIVDLADPMLLDQLAVRILSPGLQATKTVYFDGIQYPLSSEVVHTAAYLLPCEFGLACAIDNDLILALRCATGQACFATRRDHARAEMVSGNAETYAKAVLLAQQMADAIRSANVDAFVPPAR